MKQSNINYGKLPVKEAKKTPWNKLSIDIIGPRVKRRKGKKEDLNLKAVTVIDPVTGWY